MGQLLSVPMFIAGLVLIVIAKPAQQPVVRQAA